MGLKGGEHTFTRERSTGVLSFLFLEAVTGNSTMMRGGRRSEAKIGVWRRYVPQVPALENRITA
jgi:hypothetical protein